VLSGQLIQPFIFSFRKKSFTAKDAKDAKEKRKVKMNIHIKYFYYEILLPFLRVLCVLRGSRIYLGGAVK
jgi:hypothetical protein